MSPSTSKDIHEADITEGGDEVQEPISTTKDMDMAEEANPTEENTETSGMKKRKMEIKRLWSTKPLRNRQIPQE